MVLLIIRHGESEADILNVHEGRADFDLTARGVKQAAAMAEHVKAHYHVDRIYASPLKRAAHTASLLSVATEKDIVFDDDLMEFNNGLLAGLPYDEAAAKYPPVRDLPPDKAVYGQESLTEFRGRAERFLKRLYAECGGEETVAAVTHGGMINQLFGSLLSLPLSHGVWFTTYDTGIHELELKDGKVRIIRSNYSEHANGI